MTLEPTKEDREAANYADRLHNYAPSEIDRYKSDDWFRTYKTYLAGLTSGILHERQRLSGAKGKHGPRLYIYNYFNEPDRQKMHSYECAWYDRKNEPNICEYAPLTELQEARSEIGALKTHNESLKEKAHRHFLLTEEAQRLRAALSVANAKLKEIKGELYGKGLQVSGWHENGVLEPLESWFDDNDWEPVEALEPKGEV